MRPVALLAAFGMLALALFYLSSVRTASPDRAQRVLYPEGAMLAVYFAHADHVEQNCVACHHNFADATGTGMCFDCHKTDPEVADLIESQFHDLCRGCHVEQQLAGGEHGPTRRCIDCHQREEYP